MTNDSDTVFREESIGEGFKIVVTVAVFEKILLFEKKIGSSLTAIFKPTRVCSYKIFSKIEIVDFFLRSFFSPKLEIGYSVINKKI